VGLVRTEALVFKAFRFGETSMIVRLFTREQGVVPVIARGIRRPKSRFGGALEPFHRLRVTYYDKPGREIQTLKDVELLAEHPGVVHSLERMEVGGRWLRLLRAVVPDSVPAPPLWDLAASAVARLEAVPVERTGRWDAYHRARIGSELGLEPRLHHCAGCGRPRTAGEGLAFSLEEGGIVCPGCASRRPGTRPLTPREYALLLLYHHPDWNLISALEPPPAEERETRRLVREFLDYHAGLRPDRVASGAG